MTTEEINQLVIDYLNGDQEISFNIQDSIDLSSDFMRFMRVIKNVTGE